MPITAQCGCGRIVNAPNTLAGKTARCTYCGKSIAVPLPGAEPITVLCACGKKLRAPASLGGKQAKCPACGKPVTVPVNLPELAPAPVVQAAPGDPEPPMGKEVPAASVSAPAPSHAAGAEDPRARPGPRGRHPRTRRFARQAGPLPGLAVLLVILSLLESCAVGIFAFLMVLWGGFFAAAAHGLGEGAVNLADAWAQSTIDSIKQQGGTITRDEIVLGEEGRKVRRVEYTSVEPTGERSRGSYDFPLAEKESAKIKQVGTSIGGVVIAIGMGLCLGALAKVVCGIGCFVSRNWARLGIIGLCGFESLLIVLAVLTGGVSAIALIVLLLNVSLAGYFLSSPVRSVCV